jgi:hypothetical protein
MWQFWPPNFLFSVVHLCVSFLGGLESMKIEMLCSDEFCKLSIVLDRSWNCHR